MSSLEFPGVDRLIAAADAAVALEDPCAVTTALRNALCQLITDHEVRLPDCCYETCAEGYARRELHTSPQHGYSIIAMTWAPGQGTPIHDHCGLWCVEGVWAGRIEVVQYELVERRHDLYRFEERGTVQAGVGTAGSLIPPHEYHTIANASDTEPAVSVHVYRRKLMNCNVFQPVEDDWYRRCPRNLELAEAS